MKELNSKIAKNAEDNIWTDLFTYFLTTYLYTAKSSVLHEKLSKWSQSRNSPHVMKHEGLISNLHVHAKCLYLNKLNSVNTLKSYFLKIHLNVTFSSTPGSPKWAFFGVFYQTPVYVSPLSYRCYISVPSYYSTFYHKNIVLYAMHFIKLIIMNFSLLPFHLVPLRPKNSPKHPISNTSVWLPPSMLVVRFHTHTKLRAEV
jgi:hypothetical protein